MNGLTYIKRLAFVLAWVLIWQIVALIVGNQILLAGPLDVLFTLLYNVVTADFWLSIGYSFTRIIAGFLVAFVSGVAMGALAGRYNALKEFLDPAVQFVKSVPIVCIIVLLLLWFGSTYVSIIAVILITFPAIYSAVLEALQSRNQLLWQMLQVFKVKRWRQALAYYWPTLLPFLISSCRVAVGLSWKAGVAAELIGLPLGSIGENIYQAKITFSSADLFSWIIVIVSISIICERLFLLLLKKTEEWTWQVALPRCKEEADTSAAHSNAPDTLIQKDRSAEGCVPHDTNGATIRLDEVSVAFNGHPVFVEHSLTFEAGKRYALRGVSGSGKTTLLLLMEGIVKPSAGAVSVEGEISAVFQEARLFEQHNAFENVQLIAGYHASEEYITDLLLTLLPADSLDQPVRELSGGMRRRVELVRALAFASDVLLLDEPFAGLDEESKIKAQVLLLEEQRGRTLVVVTHDFEDELFLGLETIRIDQVW